MGIRKPSLTVDEARRRAEQSNDKDSPAGAGAEQRPVVRSPASSAVFPLPAAVSPPITLPPPSMPEPPVTLSLLPHATSGSAATKGHGQGVEGIPVKRTAAPRQTRVTADGAAKQQLFLSVTIPAKGVSKSFDMLCLNHTPAKALQLILKRALPLYEDRILDGTFVTIESAYEEDRSSAAAGVVQTSRTMLSSTVAMAKSHLDPLGFESERTFGRMLASAALSAFFDRERHY
jgi:hypothetical protein